MFRIDLFCRFPDTVGQLEPAVARLEAALNARFGPVVIGYGHIYASTIIASYVSEENRAETLRNFKKYFRRNGGKVDVFRVKKGEVFEDGVYDITLDVPSMRVTKSRSREEGREPN